MGSMNEDSEKKITNDGNDSSGGDNAVNNARHKKFTWNRKYLTVCLYAIIVVLASVLIIKTVIDWDNVVRHAKSALSVLSPFLWGAFIAFLINPLVKLFDKLFGKIKPLKKHEKPRKFLSLLLSYLLVVALVVLMFVYLLPQIGTSITEIVNQVPGWIANINEVS